MNAIELAEGLDDNVKAVLRIQAMAVANMGNHALMEIRGLDPSFALSGGVAAGLALIAAEAGGQGTASGILKRYQKEFSTRQDLETALRAARRIDDDQLARDLVGALEQKFPESDLPALVKYTEALQRVDHRAAYDIMKDRPGKAVVAEMHRQLADAFSGSGVPDYLGIVTRIAPEVREIARIECARHALWLGLAPHALQLLLAPEAVLVSTSSRFLCETLQTLLIKRGPNGDLAVDESRLVDGFQALVMRLSADTTDKALRARLLDLLEPSVAGALGETIALAVLNRATAAQPNVTVRPEVKDRIAFGDLLKNEQFRETFNAWTKAEAPLRVGYTRFPLASLPADADRICEGILHEIDYQARHVELEDINTLLMILAFGTAVARHAHLANLDLPLIRTTAVRLSIGGHDQTGRDIVETMLEIAETPERRRIAWFGIADIYARGNRITEAAIYAAAGSFASGDVDDHQLWHETQVVYRIQRDALDVAHALETLQRADTLLRSMGRHETYGHRIETMALLAEVAGQATINFKTFAGLLQRAVRNGEDVLDKDDEPEPIALLLATMIRDAASAGIPVPGGATEVLTKLTERLGPNVRQLVDSHGRDIPTADDLMGLLGLASGQRYSAEVGTDSKGLVKAARRALDSDTTLLDIDTVCLALELTTDRAIAAPGWTDFKSPPPAFAKTQGPAEIMREISSEGINIVLVALAKDGSLVRVTASGGVISAAVREDRSLFSGPKLEEWRENYPFLYGMPGMPANAFLTTTERLRFSQLPAGPTILITDTKLASLPPNLMRAAPAGGQVPFEYAGQLYPYSAAPSLSWLDAARRLEGIGDGRRLAWMPGGGTMASVADFCADTLHEHGFELDRQERLPDHFGGASMAIVVAHGGLNPDGGAFQVVADEGHLAATANELATSLHNVGVAILFVCSGGRTDKHPSSDATLGLARELLDQGLQAVVASPWPLESLVPPRWLPKFLSEWDAGNSLGQSVHAANLALFARDGNPAVGLAMTIFGNPEVRNHVQSATRD
ncbi:CHAT domain-containing protein [Mesorhizobium sp. WSM4887]|uniref:CHAT domain-containing protein n=1 Tax=Mesorhizobium sp. WSM4887 TaxID=3038543 RepID=UPI002416DB66|nr:CHAT domain-containing protein [Mesorhizobium sp. WSM4887]MDG4889735.1 CHAT domain-containing protein [Mesorhizobium sp. WSM4887]